MCAKENGAGMAIIWMTPSRSGSALQMSQALVVWIGDEVFAMWLFANHEYRRPFDTCNRMQKYCSAVSDMQTQPHFIENGKHNPHTYRLHLKGLTWKEVAEWNHLRDGKQTNLGARKQVHRNGLTVPTCD